MNVIFTCGGTGGHINPAIAVANTLRERHPDSRILFIGAEGEMEEKLVPMAGYEIIGLPASSFTRGLSWQAIRHNVRGTREVLTAMARCRKIIREFRPDVIMGTGGYASFPALYMGSRMGIPVCVHESNAVPGLTTRLIANRANRVLVSFESSTQAYRHPEKVQMVGMPVRREFIYEKREDARKALGIGDEPLVVSAFGSLGARAMNEAVAEMMRLERDDGFPFRHIHATGSLGWEWMPDLVREKGLDLSRCPRIEMREYLYNMPTVMAAADVIISRAGASSCNEIAASGTPCILIPSPNVTNHHQEKNAKVLEEKGAAVVLAEPDCTPRRLYDTICALLRDTDKRRSMSAALRKLAVLDSAEQICTILEQLARA